jgi:hypothetical protein
VNESTLASEEPQTTHALTSVAVLRSRFPILIPGRCAGTPGAAKFSCSGLSRCRGLPIFELVSSDRGRRPTALNSADPNRNFTLSVDDRIRALTIGVPAYAARKRAIEDDEAHFVSELVTVHDTLAERGKSVSEIELALASAATRFDLARLNARVEAHNRYYPIEANLPLDRRGRYLVYGRVWEREQPYTPARLVALARASIDRRDDAEH